MIDQKGDSLQLIHIDEVQFSFSFFFMEIDYMKGITASNAHFFELDEVGPDTMLTVEL